MKTINDETMFILIPKHDPEIQLQTREVSGKELKEIFEESFLIDCLEQGTELVYKGNNYFLDEKLD